MPGLTPYSAFEEALELGKDECLKKLKVDLERNSFEGIHDTMSWWACFNEKPDVLSPSFGMENDLFPDYSEHSSSKSQKKKKKAKKKKRKQAKASKKKNRR